MKKQLFLLTFLVLSIFSTHSFAQDSLIGHWSNDKIKLNMEANHSYIYTVTIIGVKKTFSGDWSTKGDILTLKYTLLGDHEKTATYSFDKGDLILTQKGKTSRLKKK